MTFSTISAMSKTTQISPYVWPGIDRNVSCTVIGLVNPGLSFFWEVCFIFYAHTCSAYTFVHILL